MIRYKIIINKDANKRNRLILINNCKWVINMDELDDIFSGELDKEVPIEEGKEQDFLFFLNDDLFAPALE